jgi:hypothetical protein
MKVYMESFMFMCPNIRSKKLLTRKECRVAWDLYVSMNHKIGSEKLLKLKNIMNYMDFWSYVLCTIARSMDVRKRRIDI